VLIGQQASLGFEPVFVGASDRAAALLPKPICELLLLPYVELRAHGSSPSVFEPRMMLADGCTPYASRAGAAARSRLAGYETRRAAITASNDNAISAMPVALISARCTSGVTNHNEPSTRSMYA